MTLFSFGGKPPIGGAARVVALSLCVAAMLASPVAHAIDDATIVRAAELINAVRDRLAQCDDEGLLDLAGTQRVSADVPNRPALAWNPVLARTADRHSHAMATAGFFDHVDPQGRTVGARARAVGYRYRVVGENLAAGHPSIDEAVQGWLLSPSHCRNLIDPRFTEFGLARVRSTDPNDRYGEYWTLVLGQPQAARLASR